MAWQWLIGYRIVVVYEHKIWHVVYYLLTYQAYFPFGQFTLYGLTLFLVQFLLDAASFDVIK